MGQTLPMHLWDPGEGSANEAILALLDDGRRAMDERRPWGVRSLPQLDQGAHRGTRWKR